MKRYLLFMIACVCAVTGAWAAISDWTYDPNTKVLSFTSGASGDIASITGDQLTQLGEATTITISGYSTVNQTDITFLTTNATSCVNLVMNATPSEAVTLTPTASMKGINVMSSGDYTVSTPSGNDVVVASKDGNDGKITVYNASGSVDINSYLTALNATSASYLIVNGTVNDTNKNMFSNSTLSNVKTIVLDNLNDAAKSGLSNNSNYSIAYSVSNGVANVMCNAGGISYVNSNTWTNNFTSLTNATSVSLAGTLDNNDVSYISSVFFNATRMDLSDVTLSNATISTSLPPSNVTQFILPNGASMPDYQSYEFTGNKYAVVTNGAETTVNARAAGQLAAAIGNESIATASLVAKGYVQNSDLSGLNSATTSVDLSGATLNDAINISSNSTVTKLVLPAGTSSYTVSNSTQVKIGSDGADVVLDGSTTSLEAALQSLFGNLTASDMGAAISSLKIRGTMTAADVDYLESLSGITSLDLTGVTSVTYDGDGKVNVPSTVTTINKGTVICDLSATNITYNYMAGTPALLEILSSGGVAAAISAESSSLSSVTSLKITGAISETEFKNIIDVCTSMQYLDLSEATISATTLQGTNANTSLKGITLPSNYSTIPETLNTTNFTALEYVLVQNSSTETTVKATKSGGGGLAAALSNNVSLTSSTTTLNVSGPVATSDFSSLPASTSTLNMDGVTASAALAISDADVQTVNIANSTFSAGLDLSTSSDTPLALTLDGNTTITGTLGLQHRTMTTLDATGWGVSTIDVTNASITTILKTSSQTLIPASPSATVLNADANGYFSMTAADANALSNDMKALITRLKITGDSSTANLSGFTSLIGLDLVEATTGNPTNVPNTVTEVFTNTALNAANGAPTGSQYTFVDDTNPVITANDATAFSNAVALAKAKSLTTDAEHKVVFLPTGTTVDANNYPSSVVIVPGDATPTTATVYGTMTASDLSQIPTTVTTLDLSNATLSETIDLTGRSTLTKVTLASGESNYTVGDSQNVQVKIGDTGADVYVDATHSLADALTALGLTSSTVTSLKVRGTLSSTDLDAIEALTAVASLDLTGVTAVTYDADGYLDVPASATSVNAGMVKCSYTAATYKYYPATSTTPATVEVLSTGGIANAITDHSELASVTKVKITGSLAGADCTLSGFSATEVYDLSEAAISTVSSLDLGYKSTLSDVIVSSSLTTSEMSTYTKLGTVGNAYSNDGTTLTVVADNYYMLGRASNYLGTATTLAVRQTSEDYNGMSQVGLTALNSVNVATLDLKGIKLNGGNDASVSLSNTNITSLILDDATFAYDGKKNINISGCTALTSLSMKSAVMNQLIATSMSNLTSIDASGVESTMLALGNDNPLTDSTNGIINVTGTYSNNNFAITVNDEATKNRVYPTAAQDKVTLAKDPIEYNTCTVTINRDFSNKTMSELISEAETELAKSSTTICTLIVTGELSKTDLESLDDADTATRIDLSGATLASGASIDNIQVPTSLVSLVLPPGKSVSSTLESTLASCTNFEYVYSNSNDSGATSPTYVWIAKTGVMLHVFENESSLKNSIYVKVAAKSGVSLDATSVDLSQTGMTNLQFLDVSESGLTTAAAQYYKAPHYNAYRIILPNNWSGNDMATFAANPNVGAIAAVYSYHGTTLKIMEINDNSYSPAALADPRIMRSTTTEVDIVSGYYGGQTYSQFGTNLLAALNNMGKSSFSVTKDNVTTDYSNTVGTSVKTISIETTSAAPNALTFTNPEITTLNIKSLVQTNADLNVNDCSALATLDLTSSSIKSVTANNTHITSANFTSAAIGGATDFSGATALTTFTTNDETSFNGALNLSQTALTSFTSSARFVGDISFNQCPSLASIDVTAADFANTTSKIHIDADAENADNTAILSTLTADNCIKIPSSFETSRLHPTPATTLVKQEEAVAAAVTYTATAMTFHDNNTNDSYYPTYRYWYDGTTDNEGIATLGTSSSRTLDEVIKGDTKLTQNTHAKIKVVGPLTSNSIDSLKYLNCTMLDLSDATIADGLLKERIAAGNILHDNTKFLVLPDTCTREHIVNGTALAKLTNVYSVIAVNNTSEGRDLTSWSRVSGALQPAVVSALNSAANSWTISDGNNNSRNVYTSSVSNFKKLKLSGLLNAYDLAGPVQNGAKLDANGHLVWAEDVVEARSQTRTANGGYTVYGPFSACFLLTEIDLKEAKYEPVDNSAESEYKRYYCSDMTLSELSLISTATYKVVIPQTSTVREIPADFMNCATKIRAICIPSNIRAIRTRAFLTIDYVWTTPNAENVSADPEGGNTKIDNGAKLSVDGGSTFVTTSALLYKNGKYIENPDFLDSYYTADYSTINGGGTYTIGSNIKVIETAAFNNTQPNVSDVYVLNTTAPECHVDAFNTQMYCGNNGYSPVAEGQTIITRQNYFNNRWITMLHYPRQTSTPNLQRYTDPTRSYSIATGMRDGKGNMLYFPNQSEFIRAYNQGTYGYIWNAWNTTREYGSVNNGELTNTLSSWTAENQTGANKNFDGFSSATDHQYTSFYKVDGFTGESVTSPTESIVPYYQVNWDDASYKYSTVTAGGNLYPKSEVDANSDADGSGEITEKDYRGWHQFVLNAYAANTVLEEEPYRSYISDNDWWTYCPTIDLTKKQVMELFGSESTTNLPYVSRLLYVRREYADNSIWLNFSDNLMVNKESRTHSQPYTESETTHRADQHGERDNTTGIVTVTSNAVNDNDVVMSAGVPYLIKPYREKVNDAWITQFRVFENETEAAKLTNTTGIKKIVDADLYQKMQEARTLSGDAQIALVQSGLYKVPAFVKGDAQSGTTKENVDGTSYTIGGVEGYNKSTDWTYSFIGSHYLSPLPKYCYYLGYTAKLGKVTFIYNNHSSYSSDVFRWVNETGVICPTKSTSPTFTVTAASGLNAALWEVNATGQDHIKSGNTPLDDDSFVSSGSGSRSNGYNMQFGVSVVEADSEASGISEATKAAAPADGKVYSLDGQLKGNSLKGLHKGVYVVNGKKYVVK